MQKTTLSHLPPGLSKPAKGMPEVFLPAADYLECADTDDGNISLAVS